MDNTKTLQDVTKMKPMSEDVDIFLNLTQDVEARAKTRKNSGLQHKMSEDILKQIRKTGNVYITQQVLKDVYFQKETLENVWVSKGLLQNVLNDIRKEFPDTKLLKLTGNDGKLDRLTEFAYKA